MCEGIMLKSDVTQTIGGWNISRVSSEVRICMLGLQVVSEFVTQVAFPLEHRTNLVVSHRADPLSAWVAVQE